MATRTKPGSQNCRKPDPGSIEMLCREGLKRKALHSLAACAPIPLPSPKLALAGVAFRGDSRVAFIHDLDTNRIAGLQAEGYASGGRMERIEADR
jgi:hypothetical protein